MHKKISITIAGRPKVKAQLDQLLNADYQMLNQKEDIQKNIMYCQVVKRNALLHQYIEVIQSQYNIKNPLKINHSKSRSKASSLKKLSISLKSSKFQQRQVFKNDKNKKKLTLTSKMIDPFDSREFYNHGNNVTIKTPKFGLFQNIEEATQNRANLIERKSSRFSNHLDSKEKPITTQSNYKTSSNSKISPNLVTSKKRSQLDSGHDLNQSILFTQMQLHRQATAKKNQKYIESQDQISKIQSRGTIIHRNPVKQKIQNRTKLQISKASDRFRYCVGCEQPILQINTQIHQKQCQSFIYLSNLPNELLYKKLKQKIQKIEESIPKAQQQLSPNHVQHLRSRSMNLVKESSHRKQCSGQNEIFRQNYEGIMEIGKKWSFAVQEVNKLRWFTKIVQKLQKIINC